MTSRAPPTSSPSRPRPRLPLRQATPPLSARPCGNCGPVRPGGRRRPEGGAGGGGNWRATAAGPLRLPRSLGSTAANDPGPRGPSKQEAVRTGGEERPLLPRSAARAPSPGRCFWIPGGGPSLCRCPLTPARPEAAGFAQDPGKREARLFHAQCLALSLARPPFCGLRPIAGA